MPVHGQTSPLGKGWAARQTQTICGPAVPRCIRARPRVSRHDTTSEAGGVDIPGRATDRLLVGLAPLATGTRAWASRAGRPACRAALVSRELR